MDANTKDILETVNFIKDNMATKEDLAELKNELSERIDTVEERLNNKIDGAEARLSQRIDGLGSRIDYELDKRKVLEVKVAKLEEKVGV